MKIAKCLAIVLGIVLGAAVAADAVVNIQNVGAGARSMALGNSFVAIADDPDAVFANPAGLGQIEKRQVAYTNVSLFYGGIDGDNLGQHVLSYVQPMGSRLGLGLGFERIGSDLMSENGAFLSLSYRLSRKLHLGLSGKYLFWSVGDIPDDPVNGPDDLSNTTAGGVGVDLGLMWQSPFRGAQVGLLLKNLNQPSVSSGDGKVWEDTDGDDVVDTAVTDEDAGKLPMDLHLGVAYQVNEQSLVSVQWVVRDVTAETVDVQVGEEDDGTGVMVPTMEEETSRTSKLVVGGETRVVEKLLLRAGGSRVFEEDASGDVMAGLGYRWGNNLILDYSYHIPLDLTETNGAHRFSFGYEF